MSSAIKAFGKRAKSIEAMHKKMAGGYVTRMDKNGNMHHRPAGRFRLFNPLKLFPLIAVFMAFKGYVLSKIGPDAYMAHLDVLAQGGLVDQFGARIMAMDPVTRFIATAMTGAV